jgi:hypothetical protein
MTWPMRFISTDTPATAEAGCLGRAAEARATRWHRWEIFATVMVKTKNCLRTAFYFTANRLNLHDSMPLFSCLMNNSG